MIVLIIKISGKIKGADNIASECRIEGSENETHERGGNTIYEIGGSILDFFSTLKKILIYEINSLFRTKTRMQYLDLY